MNLFWGKKLAFLLITFVVVFFSGVSFADNVSHIFTWQSATSNGSNNSLISVGAPYTSWSDTLKYINKWENSSIIWNYFEGYYYDSIYGYFKVDHLPNKQENIRITWATSKCPTGYWYKLWWYAYSDYYGFIDFDYNSNVFVYYCLSDWVLHWHAYNETLWFQNFEGITFPIKVEPTRVAELTSTGVFINDESQIIDQERNVVESAENSNFSKSTIQNDVFEFDVDKESLFYIIK